MAEVTVNSRLDELKLRRARLLERCAVQRAVLAGCCEDLQRPVKVIDSALRVVAYLRAHPLWLMIIPVVFAALRRAGVRGWLGRGMALWRVLRSMGILRKFLRV